MRCILPLAPFRHKSAVLRKIALRLPVNQPTQVYPGPDPGNDIFNVKVYVYLATWKNVKWIINQ